jgi:hypothetical protein
MGLEAPGLVHFLNLHGKFHDSRGMGGVRRRVGRASRQVRLGFVCEGFDGNRGVSGFVWYRASLGWDVAGRKACATKQQDVKFADVVDGAEGGGEFSSKTIMRERMRWRVVSLDERALPSGASGPRDLARLALRGRGLIFGYH